MTYEVLKKEIEELNIDKRIDNFKGFEESFEFEHFKTYYAMIDEPRYTLMQFKDSDEFQTSSENWIICLPTEDGLCVIDMGLENEICNQFLHLIEIYKYGFGTPQIRPKDSDTDDSIVLA